MDRSNDDGDSVCAGCCWCCQFMRSAADGEDGDNDGSGVGHDGIVMITVVVVVKVVVMMMVAGVVSIIQLTIAICFISSLLILGQVRIYIPYSYLLCKISSLLNSTNDKMDTAWQKYLAKSPTSGKNRAEIQSIYLTFISVSFNIPI